MNRLGDLQQQMYQGELEEEKYYNLYYQFRKKTENKWYSKLSVAKRKRLHKFILLVYRIKNKLGGFSFELIGDKSDKNVSRPVIFAITHVGKFDIEVVSEAIKEHYFLLSGDYEHIQGIIDAPFLGINGVIFFNEKVKSDRQSAVERMVTVLREGGNLMYFPEGTWNLSPNLPVLPCYWGIVDIARQGNAIIIPIAACQYGRHFKINIGSNIDFCTIEEGNAGKTKAICMLRDILATLSYEIYESGGLFARKSIEPNEWETYRANRFDEWTYFNLDYVDELVYRPKGVLSPEELANDLKRIIPTIDNAWLFDKHNVGMRCYE